MDNFGAKLEVETIEASLDGRVLTPKQMDFLLHERLKISEFNNGKLVNFTPAMFEHCVEKLREGMMIDTLCKLLHIKMSTFTNWRKRYPSFEKAICQVMKERIEVAHYTNASGLAVTRETSTRYNEEEQLVGSTVTEKQHPISTTSLDRLAQKYAPELAPKEKTEIDVDIQVKRIDFTKIDKAIEAKDTVEVTCVELTHEIVTEL